MCLALAASCLMVPGDARADSLDDHLGPREIALGDSLRADARGALSIHLNPAGLALTHEMVFEGTYGYRFTDSGSALTVAACDSTVAVPGCFYYRYNTATPELLGIGLSRRAHEGGVTFARPLSPRIILGGNLKYFDYNTEAPDEEDASGFTFDLGLAVRPLDILSLGISGQHLFGERSSHYPRALGAGVRLQPIPQLGVTFDALWRLEREPDTPTGRYGGGIEFFLSTSDRQSGFPLRVGAVHDVARGGTYIGGGAGFASHKLGFDIGVRRQVAGGDETVVQASVRVFGPRLVPGMGTYR